MQCMTQLYFCWCFFFFVISECYLLTSMAYDHYVANCKPLFHNVIMSPKVCSTLMLGSYLMAFSGAMAHTACMLRLTFCDANSINHYFCGIHLLLQLSCTSTYINELEMLIVVGINITAPFHSLCLLWSHPLQHPPHQVHKGHIQSLQHLQFPHHCCFSVLWIRGIYVSQTIFCCVYG